MSYTFFEYLIWKIDCAIENKYILKTELPYKIREYYRTHNKLSNKQIAVLMKCIEDVDKIENDDRVIHDIDEI